MSELQCLQKLIFWKSEYQENLTHLPLSIMLLCVCGRVISYFFFCFFLIALKISNNYFI